MTQFVSCTVGQGVADAYKLDSKGKCRDEKNKFAKRELCSTSITEVHIYKLDANKKCRDEKGKFAQAELCEA